MDYSPLFECVPSSSTHLLLSSPSSPCFSKGQSLTSCKVHFTCYLLPKPLPISPIQDPHRTLYASVIYILSWHILIIILKTLETSSLGTGTVNFSYLYFMEDLHIVEGLYMFNWNIIKAYIFYIIFSLHSSIFKIIKVSSTLFWHET